MSTSGQVPARATFDSWTPGADGATRSVPWPYGYVGEPVRTARIQNLTRGTLYVRRGQDTPAAPGAFDWVVGPYASETVVLDDVGLSYHWTGLPGEGDLVVTALSREISGPSGAVIGSPYVPITETRFFFPGQNPTAPIIIDDFVGGTIITARITNRTGALIEVDSYPVGAPNVPRGYAEPYSARTAFIGSERMRLGFPNQGEILSSLDVVAVELSSLFETESTSPVNDKRALPFRTLTQVGVVGETGIGAGPTTVYTIPAGTSLRISHASIAVATVGQGTGGRIDTITMQATRGFDGGSAGVNLLRANALVTAAGQVSRDRDRLEGPLIVRSTATANSIRVLFAAPIGGPLPAGWFTWSLDGWLIQ